MIQAAWKAIGWGATIITGFIVLCILGYIGLCITALVIVGLEALH
jgi:hypothetical protein